MSNATNDYDTLKESASRGDIDAMDMWDEYAKLHDVTSAIATSLRETAVTLDTTADKLDASSDDDLKSYAGFLRSRAIEARTAAARVA